MPKTFDMSVKASAGMPSAAARLTASSTRTMPSDTENSECMRRWTKRGRFGGAAMLKILLLRPAPIRRHEPGARRAAPRRHLHRAFADFRAPFRVRPDRHRVLARRPRGSGSVDSLRRENQGARHGVLG